MDLKALLNSLTLEEKIGQLTMISPHFFIRDTKTEIAGPVAELGVGEDKIFLAGSVLGIGDAREMIEVQKSYLAKSRHKIPLIFMADVIHGYETIFPVPLGLAASWNDKLIKRSAEIAAIEAKTAGIHVTFAPMADLVRDPRWGRVVESFGEDPYLNRRFAALQVKGFQGKDISSNNSVAACIKHYAAYGAAEAGKDYNTVDISRLNLHQNYLSGYEGGIKAGARMIMTSFNIFEGVPATTNAYLLKDVLRKSWKFKGVTISDYASLKETITHGTSATEYEAAVKGLNAGLDIEMATALYFKNLEQAVKNGEVLIEDIDAAVMRVLELKRDAGLFEDPYKGASIEREKALVFSEPFKKEALKVAHESIVLLKNDHQLFPIKKGKIALIGRYANNHEMIGPWSWHGDKHRTKTVYEVLKDKLNIHYLSDGKDIDYKKVNACDYVIVLAGELRSQSGEAHSRSMINLPDNQEEMILNLKQNTSKKMGLILFNGRPLDLTRIENVFDGILEAFFPGSMAAESIRDIIIGKVNPSGKLTMSFPRSVGQIPVYYNYLSTGRPLSKPDMYKSFYLDLDSTPLYPFGYGLSYSNFKYSNLRLSKDKLLNKEKLKVFIDVTNESKIPGKEIIQLYIKDHFAEVSRPVLELKNFKKIQFKAFETKTIEFILDKKDLTYIGSNLKQKVDKGLFSVFVGPSSDKLLEAQFELI